MAHRVDRMAAGRMAVDTAAAAAAGTAVARRVRAADHSLASARLEDHLPSPDRIAAVAVARRATAQIAAVAVARRVTARIAVVAVAHRATVRIAAVAVARRATAQIAAVAVARRATVAALAALVAPVVGRWAAGCPACS